MSSFSIWLQDAKSVFVRFSFFITREFIFYVFVSVIFIVVFCLFPVFLHVDTIVFTLLGSLFFPLFSAIFAYFFWGHMTPLRYTAGLLLGLGISFGCSLYVVLMLWNVFPSVYNTIVYTGITPGWQSSVIVDFVGGLVYWSDAYGTLPSYLNTDWIWDRMDPLFDKWLYEDFYRFNIYDSFYRNIHGRNWHIQPWFSFSPYLSYGYLDNSVASFSPKLTLRVDRLTAVMMLVITSITFCVVVYSMWYMADDGRLNIFFSFLCLFMFSMLLFVSADSLILLFAGWEGVGLCSFLLIGFWYKRDLANRAALKALLVNKVGDVALFFAILAIVFIYGFSTISEILSMGNNVFDVSTLWLVRFLCMPEYCSLYNDSRCMSEVFEQTVFYRFYDNHLYILSFSERYWSEIQLFCFAIVIASLCKSAQLGFHVWLPDAMEGPTPVSALLHAATMVTAGVVLVLRFASLLMLTPSSLLLAMFIGGLTALFAGFCGMNQYDIKRVIAYSTCSQIGLMFMAVGYGFYNCVSYSYGLTHLYTHAFFKALLFLSAGSVIHLLAGEQDIRRMGYLATRISGTTVAFVVGSAALMGAPFTAGHFSKELIVATFYDGYNLIGNVYSISGFVFILSLLAIYCTGFYSTRLAYHVFFSSFTLLRLSRRLSFQLRHLALFIPLSVLSVMSLIAAWPIMQYDILRPHWQLLEGAIFLFNPKMFLFTNLSAQSVPYAAHMALILTVFGVATTFLICFISFKVFYQLLVNTSLYLQFIAVVSILIKQALISRFYFDKVYWLVIVVGILRWSIDGFLSLCEASISTLENWLILVPFHLGKMFRYFQSGNIEWYLGVIISVTILITLWLLVTVVGI
jgi:NADH-quinone oxidoreductase subunit L